MTTPTRCGPLSVTLHTRSWQVDAPWLSATTQSAPLEGCQSLPFEPHLGFDLSNPAADAPTGVRADLSFPEYGDPDGLVGSQPKAVSIRLPDGVSVSPSGAVGLGACTDAEFGLGLDGRARCPSSSKVGTVLVESPQSPDPLGGDIYLGQERPGERFRLLVDAAGRGVEVKLEGVVRLDPISGQATANLKALPQFPITHLELNIDGGPQGLLATPLSCGSSTAAATFVPYGGGPSVDSSMPVAIGGTAGSPCSPTAPFAPEVVAGSTSLRAGGPTSFSMTMRRKGGEQLPDRLTVELPPGLSPALGTVDLCEGAAADSGACPANSRIGSVVAEVGSGPNPAAVKGRVFLTGPYRGAPYGVALVFDVALGPFDLGTVVNRATIKIDSLSGRATLQTDSLPEEFEGVPLRFRTIGLDLDRAGFLSNPTSCASSSMKATVRSRGGATAVATSGFALKGCDSLGFRPTFSMELKGRSSLRRHDRPGLQISARLPRHNTNLRQVKVSLPRVLRFDSSGLKEICARSDALSGRCPKGARIGTGEVRTSLLDKKLEGAVFVVQPEGDGSPDLWADVDGLGVQLEIRSETSTSHGRTAITLASLPDLPISEFKIRLNSGVGGVLSLRDGLCAKGHMRRLLAPVTAEGQDGAYRQSQMRVTADAGCGGARSHRSRRPTAHRLASR